MAETISTPTAWKKRPHDAAYSFYPIGRADIITTPFCLYLKTTQPHVVQENRINIGYCDSLTRFAIPNFRRLSFAKPKIIKKEFLCFSSVDTIHTFTFFADVGNGFRF